MGDGREAHHWLRATSVRVLGIVVVMMLIAAGCGGDDDAGAAARIEFLSGEIADTVPVDFPIPDRAIIGSTVVNRNLDPVFTEMTVRVPATVAALAQYYATNLPMRDFEISRTRTDSARRTIIEFRRDGSNARIELTDLGNEITSAVIQFNPPGE